MAIFNHPEDLFLLPLKKDSTFIYNLFLLNYAVSICQIIKNFASG